MTCSINTLEDGMDQSKWAIPRLRHSNISKSVGKFDRPKGKVQGIWAHHIGLWLYALDPRVPGDGSMVAETLCRVLDKVSEHCSSHSIDPPRRVLLWVPMACFFQNDFSSIASQYLCNAE